MDQRESDPTGAFRGGSAGTGERDGRHRVPAPRAERRRAGRGRPNTGETGEGDARGGDTGERDAVVGGKAATSEIADPQAQAEAERQGDGTPQPR